MEKSSEHPELEDILHLSVEGVNRQLHKLGIESQLLTEFVLAKVSKRRATNDYRENR